MCAHVHMCRCAQLMQLTQLRKEKCDRIIMNKGNALQKCMKAAIFVFFVFWSKAIGIPHVPRILKELSTS